MSISTTIPKICLGLSTSLLFLTAGCEQQYVVKMLPPREEKVSRAVEISTITNEDKPIIKLVVVVDNSRSMADEQDVLSTGTAQLVEGLRGYNVDVSVYTTSSLDAANSAQKSTHSSATEYLYVDPKTGKPVKSATPPSIGMKIASYTERTVNRLSAPLNSTSPNGGAFHFRDKMSDEAFFALKSALVDTVKTIGINGSDEEAGFCALGRILTETEENGVFSPGDKAAFLVVSDTDDWSLSDSCTRELSNKTYKYVKTDLSPIERDDPSSSAAETEWWSYTAQFRGTAGTGTPAYHRMNYDYITSQTFKVKAEYPEIKYTVVSTYHNSAPQYTLISRFYTPSYRVSYSYNYNDTCVVDEQPEACVKSGNASNVSFDPALAGSPPATSGSCPTGLQNYVKNQLLTSGQTLTACNYTYSAEQGSQAEAFNPASYGNPSTGSGELVCNSALITRAQALVPSGKVYSSCAYTYSESLATASQVFNPASYGNPPSGSGNLACNASLITLAQSIVPSGKTYKSCHYAYSNVTRSVTTNFNPANYGNLPVPSGSSAACNESLASFAGTTIPSGSTLSNCTYSVATTTSSGTKDFAPATYGITSGTSGTCNTSLRSYAQSLIDVAAPGKTLRNCSYAYTAAVPGATAPTYTCTYTDSTANVARDLCNGGSLNAGGTPYASFEAYLRANPARCGNANLSGTTYLGCSSPRQGWKKTIIPRAAQEAYVQEGSPKKLSVLSALQPGISESSNDFTSALLAKSQSLFGSRGYFFSSIIHDTDLSTAGCGGGYRASPGTKYRGLVNRLGTQGSVYPICSLDYTPALATVQEFVIRTTLNSYRVEILEGESIDSIQVRRGNTLLSPVPQVDYLAKDNGEIEFLNDFMQPGDVVVVTLSKKVLVPVETGKN